MEGGDRSTHMRCNSRSHAGTRVLYLTKTFAVKTLYYVLQSTVLREMLHITTDILVWCLMSFVLITFVSTGVPLDVRQDCSGSAEQ